MERRLRLKSEWTNEWTDRRTDESINGLAGQIAFNAGTQGPGLEPVFVCLCVLTVFRRGPLRLFVYAGYTDRQEVGGQRQAGCAGE